MAIRNRVKSVVKGVVKQTARGVLRIVDAGDSSASSDLSSRDVGLDVIARPKVSAETPAPEAPAPTRDDSVEEQARAESLSAPKADELISAQAVDEPSSEIKTAHVVDELISAQAVDEPSSEIKTAHVVDESLPVLDEGEREGVREAVVEMIQTVHDPEIPVNIYELGLIYDIDVSERGHVDVRMTLTSPNCPAAQVLPGEVETKSKSVDKVSSVAVAVVWDPPWEPSMMSEAAQLELNML